MPRKHTIQAISLLSLGSLFGAASSFLIHVILARQLGPEELGVFSSAFATVMLLTPLAGFGIASFWLKVFGKEGWSGIRWLIPSFYFVGISTFLVIIVLIAWSIFGPHDKLMASILFIASFYVLGQVTIELVISKLQLEECYKHLFLWQVFPNFSRLILVLVLAFWLKGWMNGMNVAYAYVVIAIFFTCFGFHQMSQMVKGEFCLKGHAVTHSNTVAPNIRDVIFRAWPFGLASLFAFIYVQSDIILVKYITGDSAAGIYHVAFTILMAVLLLPTTIYQKFFVPKMHRWAHHDKQYFYQIYRQGNLAMLILGLLAMVVVWLSAHWLVILLFGEVYKDAVSLIKILVFTIPTLFVAYSVGATLVTQEHMKTKVKIMGLVAVINILLNITLIPGYGAEGAAAATVLSNLILLILYYLVAQKMVFGIKHDVSM